MKKAARIIPKTLKLPGLSAAMIVGLVIFAGIRPHTSSSKAQENSFEKAAAYSKKMRGLSLLIVKNGKTVLDEYHGGYGPDETYTLASGTKSFSGVMLAAAVEDNLIDGFDEKLSDTIVEWKNDSQRSAITLRQLLSLTSGIEAGNIGRPPSYSASLKSPVRYSAGTTFQYGPVPFQIFGEIMRRKLAPRGESVKDYFERRIAVPTGMSVASWRTQDGQIDLPSGAAMTTREWAKFGEFLLKEGKFNGKQIVKAELIRELSKGSRANPNYGITFWLNGDQTGKAVLAERQNRGRILRRILGATSETDFISKHGFGSGIPDDAYAAAGAGKQRLYIIPSKKMVVVRQGRQSKFEDEEFLNLLLNK